MKTKTVQVNARKYDGRIHRSWRAQLIETRGQMLLLKGIFDSDVEHPDLGSIAKGTISYEYYWLDRWFNIFRFHEPDGQIRNHYCNINLPPTFENSVLDYVDLDLDILVDSEWNCTVLDLQEFHENALRYSYEDLVKDRAFEQIEVLKELIKSRGFPFNYAL